MAFKNSNEEERLLAPREAAAPIGMSILWSAIRSPVFNKYAPANHKITPGFSAPSTAAAGEVMNGAV